MAEELTTEQKLAVENRGGKLLVSAAAGSGKTKVLVDRLLGYILDPAAPCNIDDFLIITYTKAAAAELRGKIARKLSEHLAEQPGNIHLQRQMQRLYLAKISTVHAFCTELLRQYSYDVDLPGDFRVADENECIQLRRQAMEELLEERYGTLEQDGDFRTFVDTQGLGRDDRKVPEIVLKVYDAARCHLNPEQWLNHCVESSDLSETSDAAQTVWGAFLLEDLHTYLDRQITAMEGAAKLASEDEALQKVEALLNETLVSLRFLRESRTWDEVVQRKQISYGTMRFPKKMENPDAQMRIKAVRDGCKKGLESRLKVFCDPSEQVLADLNQTSAAIRGLVSLARAFGAAYAQLKLRRRVLDFSDLEHRTLDLLLGKSRTGVTKIAKEIAARFREVLVDEYQDSNAVQDAIFTALTADRQNCFMVGDVKQSIYRFRLADPGIFLEKYASYAPAASAEPMQGRKVLLSRNFRSGGAVLEATNDVFYRCMTKNVGGLDYGEAEALQEGIPHEALGEPEVELHVLQTQGDAYAEEAAFVADRIVELLSGSHMVRGRDGLRKIEAEDIVILLRSPGSVGQAFQDALSQRGIRSSFGSGRDLLQTGEISVLRSILQVISNPRQDIPLLAALASPVFGFTADDLARIRGKNRLCDFYEALCLDDDPRSVRFVRTLASLREISRTATLAQLLEHLFCLTRLDSIYAAMESGVECTANLREFYRIAMDFEATARRDLSQFLEYLEMLEESGLTMSENATGGAVSILSIHKSKGLEYPVVFLSGLSRSFNREDLRAPVLCDGTLGLGLSAVDSETRVRYPTIAKRAIAAHAGQENLSEELRVLYVAMTRARDRLIMTYAAKSPEKELAMIGSRLDLGGTELLAGEVSCPGEWVLMEAMCRTEAGALFELADARPDRTHLAQFPWQIQVHESAEPTEGAFEVEQAPQISMPPETVERLRRHLAFSYGHEAATRMPSKQTATQLKGRPKDEEIAEDAGKPKLQRVWRKLEDGPRQKGGREYGTAMHAIMQYIRLDCATTPEGIESELERLTACHLLTPEQAEKADREGILAFFRSAVGQKVLTGRTEREFKFSILDDASRYGEGLEGEQVLLQGVVDCAVIEPEGVTVIDFKTDFVTRSTVDEVTERYRTQIEVYASALERIYEQPVLHKYLYFFHLKKLVEV